MRRPAAAGWIQRQQLGSRRDRLRPSRRGRPAVRTASLGSMRAPYCPLLSHVVHLRALAPVAMLPYKSIDQLGMRLQRLIARLQDPVIGFDRDVKIAAVNLATERLFGYSATDLIGHSTQKLRPIDPGLRERRNRELRERGVIEGETRALNSAGDLVVVDLCTCAVGMMDTDGIEYLAVMRTTSWAVPGASLDQLYTLGETAEMLRKSTKTVRRLLAAGTLTGHKIGGTWRIPAGELERLTRLDVGSKRRQGCWSSISETQRGLIRSRATVTDVGRRIALMRQGAQLSKRQLASLAEIDERLLRRWENGDHQPSVASVRRLIPYIGGTIDYYLGPNESPRSD